MWVNNDAYREVVKRKKDIPLFMTDWWLDAVCGTDGWQGLVLQSSEFVKAIWPLTVQHRAFGRKYYIMPPLTPSMGIRYYYPPDQKYSSRLAYEKDIVNELLLQLGDFDFYQQNFLPEFTNWLPFYWNDFTQTTSYTYRISPLNDMDGIFKNFQDNIRREIRKAQKQEIQIVETEDFDLFFSCVKKTYDRQSKEIVFLDVLKRVNIACAEKKCRKMFLAKDKNDMVHSALFLVWDSQNAYYLIGGGDPILRTSGATSLLMFESIKFASTVVDCFDFEGSVIEPIEKFFRGFGAVQTPFFSINKITSKEKKIHSIINLKNKILK